MKEWPGKALDLQSIKAEKGSAVTMLGYEEPWNGKEKDRELK